MSKDSFDQAERQSTSRPAVIQREPIRECVLRIQCLTVFMYSRELLDEIVPRGRMSLQARLLLIRCLVFQPLPLVIVIAGHIAYVDLQI